MTKPKENILFFINKKAADKSKVKLQPIFEQLVDGNKYNFESYLWENQAIESILPLVEKADILVAYGGDGTINYLGALCLAYNKKLAILPFGSGNGLARHLHIPFDLKKAIDIINKGDFSLVDVIQLNDQFCFNIAGLGFDGHVAHGYAKNKGSGFWGYFTEITKGLFSFKPVLADILINNKTIRGNFFMVGVANGSQWGYGYTIFPEAKLNDGEMELFIIERLKLWQIPSLLFSFLNKTLETNKHVLIYKVASFSLSSNKPMYMHIDGEAIVFENRVNFTLLPKRLNIMNALNG